MRFRRVSLEQYRVKLSTRNFYEDITFKNKEVQTKAKKAIGEWMYNLENGSKIKVEKFKDLFGKLQEVVFPIRIKSVWFSGFGSRRFDIKFVDHEDKQYYMSNGSYFDEETSYIIGRRNSILEPLIDRDFHYEICEDKNILLLETSAMRLKPDGKNDDIVVDFCYNYQEQSTEATLKSYTTENKIKIRYPTIGKKFEQKLLEYLFHINEKWYYYDVFPILKRMLLMISNEKVSLSITAEVEKEICSKIDIVNGIVQRYTKTEIISEEEMRRCERILAKQLKEFLKEVI